MSLDTGLIHSYQVATVDTVTDHCLRTKFTGNIMKYQNLGGGHISKISWQDDGCWMNMFNV